MQGGVGQGEGSAWKVDSWDHNEMEMLKPIVHGMRDEVKAPVASKTKAKAEAEAEVEGCAKSRCDS